MPSIKNIPVKKIIEQTGKKQVQNLCKQLNQTKKPKFTQPILDGF
jgi:hypothetical protein